MTGSSRNWALGAGTVAGLLFALAVSGAVPGVLVIYLPYLPLLAIGLALGGREGWVAVAAATFVAGLALGGINGMLVFLLLIGLPAGFFAWQALAQKGQYPPSIGQVLTGLTYFTVLLQAMLILMVLNTVGDFAALLPEATDEESPMMAMVRKVVGEQTYLLLGISAWLQLLMFYGLAVLTNFLLTGWGLSRRDSLAIRPFMPSAHLLVMLLGSGLLSFTSDPAVSLIGKSAFITLLFPYFLMGISKLHQTAQSWPNRGIWLLLVYFFLSLIPHLALCFVGLGLLAQGRYLSNRFHDGTDSN